jgi:hypothetical protein
MHNFDTPIESYQFPAAVAYWQTIAPLQQEASPLRCGHTRAPQEPQTRFAQESFIDEVAAATASSPHSSPFRPGLLTNRRSLDNRNRPGSQRPDCVAGVVGLELRNVVAKYPFERSHRFPGPSQLLATETIRVGAKVRARLIVIELASEMLYLLVPRQGQAAAAKLCTWYQVDRLGGMLPTGRIERLPLA